MRFWAKLIPKGGERRERLVSRLCGRVLLVIALVMTLVSPVWAGNGFQAEDFRGERNFSDVTERFVAVVGGDTVLVFDRVVVTDKRGDILLDRDSTQRFKFGQACNNAAFSDSGAALFAAAIERKKRGQGLPFLFVPIKLEGDFQPGLEVSGELVVDGQRLRSRFWAASDSRDQWEPTTRTGREQFRVLVFDVRSLSAKRVDKLFDTATLTITVGLTRFDMKERNPDETHAEALVR